MKQPLIRPTFFGALAWAVIAASLSGCAIARPASSLPAVGWTTAPKASVVSTSPGTPKPTPAPAQGLLARSGMKIAIPEGYADNTASITSLPTSSNTHLVAALKNASARSITILSSASDATSLSDSVTTYITEVNARAELTVVDQKPTKVGGQDGIELLMKSKSDARTSSQLLTLRPGQVIMVSGATPDQAAHDAVAATASGLQFG